ncbi:transglycosylase domain-containing protein [Candidatus Gottesmanbacteria bacterium]|nr:transglycosylase domain-containing protein [Candidatus Gottesmanbacteria bacterium]
MARKKAPKAKIQPQEPVFIEMFFAPIAFLIAIGDVARRILVFFFSLPLSAYKISTALAENSTEAVVHWLAEKKAGLQPKKKRGRPRKKRGLSSLVMSSLVRKKFRKIKTLVKRFTIPKISLPKLPKLHFPTVAIPKFSSDWKPFALGVAATIIFFLIPFRAYETLSALPNPQLLARRDLAVTTKILDRNGVPLYEIYADQNRTPLPLAQIPKYVKDATVSIEDRDFYSHQGFSFRGMLRAARENLLHNRIQGGSTITQQLIKSALLTPEVKLSRKLKEILLAFWAERIFSKNQILEMYLNQVPYGGTSWGIEAAAQTYFGKSVKELTLGEATLLAGLPAAPTEYSPFGSHPEKAFERQAEVLRRMVEDHYLTKLEAQAALAETIHVIPPRTGIRAPHFVMYIRGLLEDRYGPRAVAQGGLRVKTSLDITTQEKMEDIVRTHIEALKYLRVGNGAALVTNPKTGEILAMVGSKNYFDLPAEGNVNVTTSLRQPGSSIKVVNYAAALENGMTAATVIDDAAVVYNVPGSPPYAPVNYDGKFHGLVTLRYALGNSYNVPAVKTLARIGVKTMIDKGRAMGITTWEDESRYGLSLTLGGGDVTILDMAKVFGTLANGGRRVDLLPILEVSDYTGKIYEKNKPKKGEQAVKPEVAWILGNILSDNAARTNAFGPSSALVVPDKTVSVKTGTSNDKRDNWTLGYTPSVVAAVWVGNNNNAPMDPYLTSGVTGASPIWHDMMVELLKDKLDEVLPQPENVVALPCHFGRVEYFVKGTEPPGGRCAPLPTPTPTPSPTP